ncbi:uncharacterized protein PAC_13512 [Phialocephala subalpina]|uniref:Uncharacterized protein n=1 Tax=Phialocephala subalpina TaxID=576137 RepID=A0A1L7XEZ6_9HELO|nr:uncharacterized protein PAC_13512 [Phialocephala subalpina]
MMAELIEQGASISWDLHVLFDDMVLWCGDSWTDTAFDPKGAQPSLTNPMGNPDFPGRNAANATNWVGFLTTKYNASLLKTYNIAVSGAILDNHIIQGYPNPISTQVYKGFMGNYEDRYSPPWTSSNSLLDALYGSGARNFAIINVPPLGRTWQPEDRGKEVKEKFKSDVAVYNERVSKAAVALNDRFDDTNVFFLNAHENFNRALDDPKAFPQTSGILNTTDPCVEYQSGTPASDYFNPRCGIPVNQYFWLNGLHPTYPIHDVLAEHIGKLLDQGPNI